MDYDATGGITIGGCAAFKVTKRFTTAFAVGSRVYIRKKALNKGKLESVVIKKINRVMPASPTCMGIQKAVNYLDTFNRVWMEEELVWQADAVILATLYWESVKASMQSTLTTCSPPQLGKCSPKDTPLLRRGRKC